MGKLRGKVTRPGDMGMLKYKNEVGEKVECRYDQPYSKELGLIINTVVNFELVSNGTDQIAIAVNPIEKGEILDVNFDEGTGTILETESGTKYPFRQNFLRESKFDKGVEVNYTLINVNGTTTAVCLTLVQ